MWAVRFENVSKRYSPVGARYASIRADLVRAAGRMVGRGGNEADYRRQVDRIALDDVSFEIEEGSSCALIGPNGAGKSTSLRLVSRITYPTAGRVRVRGRVGALIEVGAGVHPELTGRENIWLYGSFLGISRADIRLRFDDIVDFSELHSAIDTQVKFYSSGMQLRLGFAIAAFLRPNIFVVDESLAVGDVNFQTKCIRLMSELVRSGTTLLFVSHDLGAVQTLCTRGVLIDEGHVKYDGEIHTALDTYLTIMESRNIVLQDRPSSAVFRLSDVSLHDDDGATRVSFAPGEPLVVRLRLECEAPVHRPTFGLTVRADGLGDLVECAYTVPGTIGADGAIELECRIDQLPLRPRPYHLWCSVVAEDAHTSLLAMQELTTFRIDGSGLVGDSPARTIGGPPVVVPHRWTVVRD